MSIKNTLGALALSAYLALTPNLKAETLFKSIEYKGNDNYVSISIDGEDKEFHDLYSYPWRLDKEWGIPKEDQTRYIDELIDSSLEERAESKFQTAMKNLKDRPVVLKRLKKSSKSDLDYTLNALRVQESGFNKDEEELCGCFTEFQFNKYTYESTKKEVLRNKNNYTNEEIKATTLSWEYLLNSETKVQETFAKLILKVKKERIKKALGKDKIAEIDADKFLFAAYNAGESFIIDSTLDNFKDEKGLTWKKAGKILCSYENIKKNAKIKGKTERQTEWRIRRKMMILPEYVKSCTYHKKRLKEEFPEKDTLASAK